MRRSPLELALQRNPDLISMVFHFACPQGLFMLILVNKNCLALITNTGPLWTQKINVNFPNPDLALTHSSSPYQLFRALSNEHYQDLTLVERKIITQFNEDDITAFNEALNSGEDIYSFAIHLLPHVSNQTALDIIFKTISPNDRTRRFEWAILCNQVEFMQTNVDSYRTSRLFLYERSLEFGRIDIVKFFVDSLNCSPNQPTRFDESPLFIAIRNHNLQLVCYLVERGGRLTMKFEIQPCIASDFIGALTVMLESLDLEARNPLINPKTRKTIGSPLQHAIVCSSPKSLQYLLDLGANALPNDENIVPEQRPYFVCEARTLLESDDKIQQEMGEILKSHFEKLGIDIYKEEADASSQRPNAS